MNKIGKKPRQSGIELLKILAMLLIVISHVTKSLTYHPVFPHAYDSYFIDLNLASSNISNIIMTVFRYFGEIGNDIFFVCSAWFLVDNNKLNKKKTVNMIFNVWTVSVIFLAVFLLAGVNVSYNRIIKSIFPTTFSVNWYITAYILIYLIHPALNRIINSINQKQLFLVCIVMFIMYSIINTIYENMLFSTGLVVFIMLYFITAYLKKYCLKYTGNLKLNRIMTAVSAILIVLTVLFLEFAGLKIGFLKDKMLYFNHNEFPFIILLAFSLLFVFKSKNFVNKFINSWSSLTLYIYITHENILFRNYIRPYIFVFIKDRLGYLLLPVWILIASLLLFLASSLVSLLYQKTLSRIVGKFSDWFYVKIAAAYDKFAGKIIQKSK